MKNWIHISYYETCKGKNMQTVYFSPTQTLWCLGQLLEIHKTITTLLQPFLQEHVLNTTCSGSFNRGMEIYY